MLLLILSRHKFFCSSLYEQEYCMKPIRLATQLVSLKGYHSTSQLSKKLRNKKKMFQVCQASKYWCRVAVSSTVQSIFLHFKAVHQRSFGTNFPYSLIKCPLKVNHLRKYFVYVSYLEIMINEFRLFLGIVARLC